MSTTNITGINSVKPTAIGLRSKILNSVQIILNRIDMFQLLSREWHGL